VTSTAPTSAPQRTAPATTALRLVGRDALAVLHRISTNALEGLGQGRARATLFCDFRGRLLQRAVVAVAADGGVWLLRDDAPAAPLLAHVDRHVFREDVRFDDRSQELPVSRDDDAELEPGTVLERDGNLVAARPESGPALALSSRAPGDDRERERRRIEAGWAAHGREIVEAFTPYEVGLGHEVHLDKGCFTGQEALMRLVTYRSVRRRLARVAGPGAVPTTPDDLLAGGDKAGILTSTLADGDRWVGLAVIRNELLDSGTPLSLVDGRALEVEAFPPSCPLGRP
jgi:folate-binding protein YgfZ